MAAVCICCSGRLTGPQPTFSWVWNLIFLNRVTCQATITSPRCAAPAWAGIGLVGDVEDLQGDPEVGIGVVVDVHPPDVGLPFGPVEPVDVVLDALVEVDGLLVQEEGSGEEIDLADDPVRVRGRVEDDDVLLAPRCEG